VQTTHPGMIQLEGDTAVRACSTSRSSGRLRDGKLTADRYAIYQRSLPADLGGLENSLSASMRSDSLDTTPLVGNGRAHGDPELTRTTLRSSSHET